MAWETTLLRKTRHGAYKNCLDLIDAYSDFAPWWERVLLAIYAGVGPPLARCFGSNTRNLWRHADAEDGDDDLARALTPKGAKQAARMAAWLDARLPKNARMIVSPALRAQQTAEPLSREAATMNEVEIGRAHV